MSVEHYPADLVITGQDFTDCGWRNVLSNMTRQGYSSMWQAFSSAARQAMEEGQPCRGKVLWMLADACSMMLSPESFNEPFKPFVVMGGQRSTVPDDLPEADITFFSKIVDAIDDPWLKARVADLIWLKRRPRDIRFALSAIDCYRSIPLDAETWMRGGKDCWKRAISLARMLKEGAGDRLKAIETAITEAFRVAGRPDGFLSLWLADLLHGSGLAHDKAETIAQGLESLARECDNEGDLRRAREFFGGAANWFKVAEDDTKLAEMTVAVAEIWVKEAVAKVTSDKPSHMADASFYENAIQIYRTIPRSERAIHQVDQRIEELRVQLSESGEKSLDEMGVVRMPGVDISEIVENARNAVTGKSAIEALEAFANLHHGAKAKELRASAIKRIQQHPLHTLFPATIVSRDGRVIAKRPALRGSGLSDDDEIVIRAEMIHNYGITIRIVVQGDIWPALEVLLLEHRFTEADFVSLAGQSPIVPKGRERLFGMALFAGYERDYVTALHLLVPQIEHMVRYHLKQVEAKTTTLGIDGIENEIGLSTLMELPDVERVFGDDLAFEIKSLFCDSFGPNLRNEVAHGLLDDDACQSIYSIYAWWFGLRLVFNTYWNAGRDSTKSGGEKI